MIEDHVRGNITWSKCSIGSRRSASKTNRRAGLTSHVIWDGGVEELRRRHGRERILVVDLEQPAPPLEVPGARVVRIEGPRQWLAFRGDQVRAATLTAEVAARSPLVDLAIEETDIEEIVRRIYSSGA